MEHRIRTAHAEPAGRLLSEHDEPDGVHAGPEGEAVRQVVHHDQRMPWDCTTWVTRHGVVYDRCYDPIRRAFLWTAAKSTGMDPHSGHFTTVVGRDSDTKRQIRLVRAIACAWLEPPRTGVKLQACVVPGAHEPSAENLVWVRTGVRDFAYEGMAAQAAAAEPAATDAWRPLKYQWRSICGEVVHSIDEERDKPDDPAGRYHVSARGWVRSPHTERCTRGVRSICGRHYASVAGVGAFWVDEAVLHSFEHAAPADGVVARAVHVNGVAGDSCLANLKWATFVMTQLRHEEALAAMASGGLDGLRSGGRAKSTAWDRLASAAAELPRDRLGPLRSLSPNFLVDVLRERLQTGELDAADPVSRCVDAADEALGQSHDIWGRIDLHDKYGLVRVTRALVLRDAAAGA